MVSPPPDRVLLDTISPAPVSNRTQLLPGWGRPVSTSVNLTEDLGSWAGAGDLATIGYVAIFRGIIMRVRHFAASVLAMGCAVSLTPPALAQDGGGPSAEEIGEAAGEVVLTPLSDLNLRPERVPAILLEIDSPYQPISPRRCSTIGAEVTALTAALGPDAEPGAARS